MRKAETACYKQFLVFLQCFPQLHIFSASKYGIAWNWVKPYDKHEKMNCSSETCIELKNSISI